MFVFIFVFIYTLVEYMEKIRTFSRGKIPGMRKNFGE